MKRADYAEISQFYDEARPIADTTLEIWLGLIRQHSGAEKGATVLDLGCGTGRFSVPMANRLGFGVIGADLSQDMLDKAAKKDVEGNVRCERVDAAALPFEDGSFDVVWISHLLHHVDSPAEVVAQSFRVLRAPGSLLIRYGAIEQIVDSVEHRMFPEASEIDKARTPSVPDVERWLKDAGFQPVVSLEVVQETYPDAQARLRAVKARSASVFTLISPQAFEKGLSRMERYIAARPDDPWLRDDRLTLTVGTKR